MPDFNLNEFTDHAMLRTDLDTELNDELFIDGFKPLKMEE